MNKNKLRKRLLALTIIGLINAGVISAYGDTKSSKNVCMASSNSSKVLQDLEFERNYLIIANSTVNIRVDNNTSAKKIGTLKKGETVKYTGLKVDNWYRVEYENQVGYVSADYTSEYTTYTNLNAEIIDMAYTNKDTKIYIPSKLTLSKKLESKSISENEYLEVLDETSNSYLVATEDLIGYIPKRYVTTLTGTYVVVDISDQELSLYVDDILNKECDVVTGKPSTPTHEGIYDIYAKTYNRDLIGPNYRSYVNYMFSFNGGEGLHDAEYWTDENGKKHGWRTEDEFGGDTYLTNGSHGCVNMKHEDVAYLDDYVEVGTKVIIKK